MFQLGRPEKFLPSTQERPISRPHGSCSGVAWTGSLGHSSSTVTLRYLDASGGARRPPHQTWAWSACKSASKIGDHMRTAAVWVTLPRIVDMPSGRSNGLTRRSEPLLYAISSSARTSLRMLVARKVTITATANAAILRTAR
jgi:hypothetical protein